MEEKATKKVVTRFAPSPTGFMHTGNLHTGLFAWLFARKNNGKFILRIEDTDKKREVEGSIEQIKRSLKWLGLDWDEGPDVGGPNEPYVQSERILKLKIYQKYAELLIEKDYAYADENSEEQIDELRKQADADKKPFLFREHRPENPPKWKPGIPLRFKIKELKRTTWHDAVRGELTAGPEALDDFILIKSDGYPTYNFAHIVDDIEMGVTHVTRGQEFISSTPNYIAVYEALGAKQPVYVSVPHIMGEGGKKKLGKRDGAKDVLEYEKEGYLPDAMVNFLALMGWNPGGDIEIFTRSELISLFSLEKIQKSGAQFNEEKLDWINKEHMKMLPKELIEETILEWLPEGMQNPKLVPEIFERISKWGDIKTWVEEKKNIANSNNIKKEHLYGDLTADARTADFSVTNFSDSTKNDLKTDFSVTNVSDSVVPGSNDYLIPDKHPNIYSPELLIPKELIDIDDKFKIVASHLEEIKKFIKIENNWEKIYKKDAENLIWKYAEENGKGKILWPLRKALSGEDRSFDPFKIMELIGKESSEVRIENAIKILNGEKFGANTKNETRFTN